VSGDKLDTGTAIVRDLCYQLPEHVYACRTDDGVIFLDAKRDRYFGLGGAGVAALPHFVSNWPGGDASRSGQAMEVPHAEVHRVADSLIQRGLLCRGRDESPPRRTGVPPLSVDLPKSVLEAQRSPRVVDLIYFAIACVRALWLIKRLPLVTIASRVTAARSNEGPLDLVEVFGLVQVFRRLRRLFFSEKDRCLLSALALVLFLRYYGHFPLFVIGVKTRPFAAHSWVQQGELLLEGDPASICHFVPILVA
jgi:hypothetical protein